MLSSWLAGHGFGLLLEGLPESQPKSNSSTRAGLSEAGEWEVEIALLQSQAIMPTPFLQTGKGQAERKCSFFKAEHGGTSPLYTNFSCSLQV